MSHQSAEMPSVAAPALADPRPAARSQAAVCHCLIASADRRHRESLKQAAVESGWRAVVCRDAETALAESRRWLVQLAVVDIRRPDGAGPPGYRGLVEELAGQCELLLVVCGNQANAMEEIWARQLGAWLYLPGVTGGSDLAMLCGEAKQIVQQRDRSAKRPAGAPGRK